MARNATTASEVLTALGPNRTAAHSKTGSGAYSRAGISVSPLNQPNATKPTVSKASVRAKVSNQRQRESFGNQGIRTEPHSTISGTIVTSASTFARKRIRHICQYPTLPNRLKTTKPASRNDDKNGAVRAANRKIATCRISSNNNWRLMKWRMNEAPMSASIELLTNQESTI